KSNQNQSLSSESSEIRRGIKSPKKALAREPGRGIWQPAEELLYPARRLRSLQYELGIFMNLVNTDSDARQRRSHPSRVAATTLVSGIKVQTRAVAHSPTAAKLKKAAPTPRWSATSPATVVLNVAPPPMASPTSPSEVV